MKFTENLKEYDSDYGAFDDDNDSDDKYNFSEKESNNHNGNEYDEDIRSVSSVKSDVPINDEMKQFKEYKALISEKTEPKEIKQLN